MNATPFSCSRAFSSLHKLARASRPARSSCNTSRSFHIAHHGQPARRPSPSIATASAALLSRRALATSAPGRRRHLAHNNEEVPQEAPTTDFGRMDMLGDTPAPSTSVDVCMSEGFQLNNGIKVLDGSGVLLVNGEAFAWRPWGPDRKLVNARGQWEVPGEALALLGLVWPRPGEFVSRPSFFDGGRFRGRHFPSRDSR